MKFRLDFFILNIYEKKLKIKYKIKKFIILSLNLLINLKLLLNTEFIFYLYTASNNMLSNCNYCALFKQDAIPFCSLFNYFNFS